MRACSTAGGGVMFIPDEIERKTQAQSYKDLIEDDVPAQKERKPLLGRILRNKKEIRKAA